MEKEDVLDLIDKHKNSLVDPVEMLRWTYLRVFVFMIPEEEFHKYMLGVMEVCNQ